MGRRTNTDGVWIGLAAQLAGLAILLGLISPQVRQAISAIGFIAVCFLGITVFGLIGFGMCRWSTRSRRQASSNSMALSSRADAVAQAVNILRIEGLAQIKRAPQTTAELLEQLRSIDWFQFEKLVALVYRKLGYTVTRRGGANPDGGVDLVVEKDGRASAVQCKQWKKWNVGVRDVREFLGALTDTGLQQGIFITLCGYTGEARRLAEKHGIAIVNEAGLAQMLKSSNAEFDVETLAILRDTRKSCPKCEGEMVLRTATKGWGAGRQFWGCSAYPRCRFARPA